MKRALITGILALIALLALPARHAGADDLDFAQRLTQQGYVTLVPAFLEAYGITQQTRFSTFTADAEPLQAAIGYYGTYSGAGTDTSLMRFYRVFTKSSAPVLILHGNSDGTVPGQVAQTLCVCLVRQVTRALTICST